MLNIFRKKAQSTLIQGMVLMIAVVFVFWGVGSSLNKNRNSVATVNGAEITYKDFQQAYDRAVENMRNQFGGQIPPGFLEKLGIKQQVIAQLIQTELVRQGGKAMGITVSDVAVQKEVEKMKVFQQDGHFELARYKALLTRNKLTPKSFENGIKAEQLGRRVTTEIGGFAVVPDTAVNDYLAYTNEEIKLAYAAMNSTDFEDKVEIKDGDLAAWFEKNKEKYRSEPKVQLQYLFFGFDEDAAKIELSDEELKTQYEANKGDYEVPEKRHARHILFKVAESDSKELQEEKKKKAEEVLALARQGNDFAVLAEEYSEGPTKERGGDLGTFSRGQMVPTFDDAVFSIKAGEVSDLVKTRFGYHIIKVDEVFPASIRSFEVVKDNLAASLKKQKARGLSFERGTKTYEAIMRAGNLTKYGQLGKEKVVKTDYFSRSNPPVGVTADQKFLDTAFTLKKGELSSLVELPSGYAIVYIDDIQEPALPELADVKDRVIKDFSKEKAVELARIKADKLLAASREKGSLQDAAGDVKIQTSEFVKRKPAAGKDVPPSQLIQEGFALPWNKKLPTETVKVGNVFYVFEVADRRLASENKDTAQLEQVREQLQSASRQELIGSWLGKVQETAKIWTNPAFLK
jgi:peptidyl-prolyl cis-trans isomerase D